MDEPPSDPPNEIPPPPHPGGFKAEEKEVTAEEMRELRDSWLGGPRNSLRSNWMGMEKAFGQLITHSSEQQGQFRDEAARDRRALIEVSNRQIAQSERTVDAFIAEGAARRDDLAKAMQTFGAGMDTISAGMGIVTAALQTVQQSLVGQQDGFRRMEAGFGRMESMQAGNRRYMFGGASVLLAISLGAALIAYVSLSRADESVRRVDSIERRIGSEVVNEPRAAAAP